MESKAQLDYDIWGVGLVIPVSQFRVFGEYWQDTTFKGEDDAWNAGIGYGMKDLKKPGTWSLDVAYNNVGEGVYLGGTGLQTDVMNTLNYSGKDSSVARYSRVKFLECDRRRHAGAEYLSPRRIRIRSGRGRRQGRSERQLDCIPQLRILIFRNACTKKRILRDSLFIGHRRK